MLQLMTDVEVQLPSETEAECRSGYTRICDITMASLDEEISPNFTYQGSPAVVRVYQDRIAKLIILEAA